jgi:hypothetical protein
MIFVSPVAIATEPGPNGPTDPFPAAVMTRRHAPPQVRIVGVDGDPFMLK